MSKEERDIFDKMYVELEKELQIQAASVAVTESVISGRLSFYLLAHKALEEELTLENFVNASKLIISEELKTGKVDESSFKILEGFTYPDERLPGL